MRRFLILLSLLGMAFAIPKIHLQADDDHPEITISFDKPRYEEGETAVLSIFIKGFVDLYGFQIDLNIDQNFFDVVSPQAPFRFEETYFNVIKDQVFINQHQQSITTLIMTRRLVFDEGYTEEATVLLAEVHFSANQKIDNSNSFLKQGFTLDDLRFGGAGFSIKLSDSNGQNIDYLLVSNNVPPTFLNTDALMLEAGLSEQAFLENIQVSSIYPGDLAITYQAPSNFRLNRVGSYDVTFTATDRFGNQTSKIIRVEIVDTTPPGFTVRNQTITVGQYTSFDWTTVMIDLTDNAEGEIALEVVDDGVLYDTVGSYLVTVAAIDVAQNRREQSFRVTVVDAVQPIITLLGNSLIVLEVFSTFQEPGFTVSDGAAQDVIVSGAVDMNRLGSYTLSYDVTNSDGIAAQTVYRTVQVVDTTAPTITLIGSSSMTHRVKVAFRDPGVRIQDNYDTSPKLLVEGEVDVEVLGLYEIRYTAEDQSGNQSLAISRFVEVIDDVKPIITLNGSSLIRLEVGTDFSDPGVTVTDNYDTDLVAQVSGAVDTTQLGSYELRYDVTDSSGNIADTVIREVRVIDFSFLSVKLEGDAEITIEAFSDFVDPLVTFDISDDYPFSAEEVIIQIEGLVNTDVLGTYTVQYFLQGAPYYESKRVSRVVHVVDSTPPTVELIGDATVLVDVFTEYVDRGVRVADNYDLNPQLISAGSVNISQLGIYVITYQAIDASKNASMIVSRTVNVVDRIAPMITLDGEELIRLAVGEPFVDPGATVTDNVDSDLEIRIIGTVNPNVPGIYQLFYEAEDRSGNSAVTKTRIVRVYREDGLSAQLNAGIDTIYQFQTHIDAGITVTDEDGFTFEIEVSSNVNIQRVGHYTIVYKVTNAVDVEIIIERHVHIIEALEIPSISWGLKASTLPFGSEVDHPFCEYVFENYRQSCGSFEKMVSNDESNIERLRYRYTNDYLNIYFDYYVFFYEPPRRVEVIVYKEELDIWQR